MKKTFLRTSILLLTNRKNREKKYKSYIEEIEKKLYKDYCIFIFKVQINLHNV